MLLAFHSFRHRFRPPVRRFAFPSLAGLLVTLIALAHLAGAQEIEPWLQRLGSPEFAQREAAAAELSRMGEPGRVILRQAAEAADPQVASRARALLDAMGQAPSGQMTDAEREAVATFGRSDAIERDALLRSWASQGNTRRVLLCLERYPDSIPRLFKNDAASFNSMLLQAAIEDYHEAVAEALDHPLTREHSLADTLNYHRVHGTLEALLQNLEIQFAQQRQAGLPVSQKQVLSGIAMLRIQRQFDRARRWLPWLTDTGKQRQLQRQMLFEAGDWQAVAQHLVPPEQENPDASAIVANAPQRALIQRLAGDEPAYNQTIAHVAAALKQAREEEDAYLIEALRGQLLLIGLTNLDWPLVESQLAEIDSFDRYNFYSDLYRYREAFATIGLGSSVDQRYRWFQDTLQRLQELRDQMQQRLSQRDAQSRDTRREINLTEDLLVRVAGQLGTLGRVDEAELYYRLLFAHEDENQTLRSRVLLGLLLLERYDTVWRLVEQGFPDSGATNLANQLFGDSFPPVRTWVDAVAGDFEDPLELLRTISGVARSPLGQPEDFDLDLEVARYRAQVAFTADGNTETILAQLYELHGDDETSAEYYRQAALLDSPEANRMLTLRATLDGDWEAAAADYTDYWKTRRSATEAMLAADAYQRLAQLAGDEAARENWSQRSRQCQLAAFALWRGRSYGVPNTLARLDSLDQLPLASWYLQASVYGLDGEEISDSRYRSELALALSDPTSPDPRQGAIEAAIQLFDDLAPNNVAAKTLTEWSLDAQRQSLARALANIRAGDGEAAAEVLIRCATFHLGDTTLGEDTLRLMRERQMTAPAQRVVQEISGFYDELLAEYPQAALHQNNYAWLLACWGARPEDGLQHARQAVALRSDNPSYLDTLAELCFQSGQLEEAVALSRRCVQLNPGRNYYRQQRDRFQKAWQARQAGGATSSR